MRHDSSQISGWAVAACLVLLPGAAPAADYLVVDLSKDLGPSENRVGFLHGLFGGNRLDRAKVAELHPKNWRLTRAEPYQEARKYIPHPQITYVLSDAYANFKGGYDFARPWLDWDEYEQFILDELIAIHTEYPDILPSNYDIWNEPDHPYFWRGTYDQMLETFARCYTVVKVYDPGARMVGPSISQIRPGESGVAGITDFLVDLDQRYGIRLEAVSWHENGGVFYGGPRPDQIPEHAGYVRTGLARNFPPEYQPELHVNEFTGTQTSLSPGWNLGYLYFLDAAGIDAAMRACWTMYSVDPPEYWGGCAAGLDGMFMKDGERTQPAYWVNHAYAQMDGKRRVAVSSSDLTTNAFAVLDDESKTATILIGRHWHASADTVLLTVTGYPYSRRRATVEIRRIPQIPEFYHDPPKAIPLDEPELVWRGEIPVQYGMIPISLEDFQDGEAYILTISIPDPEHYGQATPGTGGMVPKIGWQGYPELGTSTYRIDASTFWGGQPGLFFTGYSRVTVDIGGGTYLNVLPPWIVLPLVFDGLHIPGQGHIELPIPIPADPVLDGFTFTNTFLGTDPGAPLGWSGTGGLETTVFQ